jgi:hypothetical protein
LQQESNNRQTRCKQESNKSKQQANKRAPSYFGLFNFGIKLKRANKQETGTPQRNRTIRAKMSTEALLNNVLRLEQELASALKSLKLAVGMDQIAEKLEQEPKEKVKKQKKDPDAPKKEPNAWIKFTMRLSELLKAKEISLAVVHQKSFASLLKKQDGVDLATISDEHILKELNAWTPPPLKARASASASASTEASSSESASESGAEGKEKKARKPQSEETKAAAAIKRAATKAAKQAMVKLSFEPWSYEGDECWQNERGDSLNPEGEWIGRFVKGKMTMKEQSEMPSDLAPFIEELMA